MKLDDSVRYFLPNDYEALKKQIEDLRQRVLETKKMSAEAVEQSSESWHDNYPFEEAQRQLKALLAQLGEHSNMWERAQVVDPIRGAEAVAFGSTVRFRNLTQGFTDVLTIGSYHVFAEENREQDIISYESPLGRLLYSHKVGDRILGVIGGRDVELEILEIQ